MQRIPPRPSAPKPRQARQQVGGEENGVAFISKMHLLFITFIAVGSRLCCWRCRSPASRVVKGRQAGHCCGQCGPSFHSQTLRYCETTACIPTLSFPYIEFFSVIQTNSNSPNTCTGSSVLQTESSVLESAASVIQRALVCIAERLVCITYFFSFVIRLRKFVRNAEERYVRE